jgi:ApaG protein
MSTSATLQLIPCSCIGSSKDTRGIRIDVSPSFVPDHSDSVARRYVFAYRIKITNSGDVPARLVSRRWQIVDSHGTPEIVEGEGVVGLQPRLEAGQSHEYSSFCPLRTPWGTMQGEYTFVTDEGERFEAEVGRFYLVSPAANKR